MDKYVVDFCCQEKKLIIEIDGGHHGELKTSKVDAEKQTYLESKGYTVLRFWNNELSNNLFGVLEVIRQFVLPTSHPTSPHRLRRGVII